LSVTKEVEEYVNVPVEELEPKLEVKEVIEPPAKRKPPAERQSSGSGSGSAGGAPKQANIMSFFGKR